jgi:gluconolactonase
MAVIIRNAGLADLVESEEVACLARGFQFTEGPLWRPDGSLFFPGVYAFDPGEIGSPSPLRLLAADFEKPNGLAFSPDEGTLYVCDTARYHIRAFQMDCAGGFKVGSDRVFAREDPKRPGGPDGIKVDLEGRVYVAVAEGIWVFDQRGRLLGILSLSARPSNLAWCDLDGHGLAMTAGGAVYLVRLRVQGQRPPFRT